VLLIGFVALMVALLGVFGYVIVESQTTSRREAEKGFGTKAAISAQLAASIFTTGATSAEGAATKAFGGRTVDVGALTAAAKKSNAAYMLILDRDGKLLAASRGAPAAVVARATSASKHIRAALDGSSSLSDELPAPTGKGHILEWALPFKTPFGRRVEVSTIDSGLIFKFLNSYLDRARSDVSARAYVLDSQNRIVAASEAAAKPGDRPHASTLLNELVTNPKGTYRDDGVERYFASAPVQGSSWRVVLDERTSRLYPVLAGSRSWFLFALLGAFALAGAASLLFFRRALKSGARLTETNRELTALNATLEQRVAERTEAVAERERAEEQLRAVNEELEHRAAELESQNTELELQSGELESQQIRLETVNEELGAQHAELERALAELAEEKERIEGFYTFDERLAREVELDAVVRTMLTELADFAQAEVGTLYAVAEEDDESLLLAATRGLDREHLAGEIRLGVGLAGRAAAERQTVRVSYGVTELRLETLGHEVALRHELHVPLVRGDRLLGVLTIARCADRPFSDVELEAIEHLADHGAIVLEHALILRRARRQSAMQRAVLDAARDGIRLVDVEGRTLLANPAIERITTEVLGLPADSTLKEREEAILPRLVDPGPYRAAMAAIAADPEAETEDEFEYKGVGRLFKRIMRPVYDGAGVLMGRLIVVREITADREARRRLESAHAALESTRDGVRLVDLEGRTLLANPAMAEITEAIGMPANPTFEERLALAERLTDPASYLATMETIASDPESKTLDEFEVADSGRSFERFTAPVRDSLGVLIGRVLSVREVTAERQAERLKSEVLATVSHELRTPLASILGFSELLVERRPDQETGDRYLETIHREAQRLTSLIDDFLDLQRIEEGGFTLALEPFELDKVLAEQVEVFVGQSEAHKIDVELPAAPVIVLGERARIAEVVGNLLSNAIKYSPAGGQVAVAAELQNGAARVSVTDSGLGIPADQQKQVFTKFFRVDSSDNREIGGTGLGLALCREIVEAHSGQIGFESVEGQGSTFWFELPVGKRANGAGRRRVLIVEDDPASAELISQQLATEGYEIETVATGEEALARAKDNPPGLVCLGIGLAGKLDGWQVLASLKAQRATADVPVVVCTAAEGREQAVSLGAADFLTKPVSARRLRETVKRLLPPGGRSVLIVDDEEAVRRLVVETLSSEGLEVREAADGEEALAAVAERRPDAIVLDLVMPKLDGFGVLERLQQNPETRAVPVVVLTARRLSGAERKSLSARAVPLLEKNVYSPGELRRLVDQALG
jgi:signal transduction histidine kinase/CheY-like chemotaxis protein/putative methionine-R-sulfoxide reductase with GAF domain